jgi:hypothetical protein
MIARLLVDGVDDCLGFLNRVGKGVDVPSSDPVNPPPTAGSLSCERNWGYRSTAAASVNEVAGSTVSWSPIGSLRVDTM